MKNFVLFITALILGTPGNMAASSENKVVPNNAYNNNAFIFVENGVTFSVYPDGEFDFYIDGQVQTAAGIHTRNASFTFNSGYNYDPFVQYDDYGAVIQVEDVPVYYDYYGRVEQIGDVQISYRNNRLYSLGGMYVFYNNSGFYNHHTGFINTYNRYYVYHPYHGYFARPSLGFCLVYNRPYRRYYAPVRYTYYSPYYNNSRRAYAKVGSRYTYNNNHKRNQVYRNDNRVVARENGTRRSDAGSAIATRSTMSRSGSVNRNSDRNTLRSNGSESAGTVRRSGTRIEGSSGRNRSEPTVSREKERTVRSSDRSTSRKEVAAGSSTGSRVATRSSHQERTATRSSGGNNTVNRSATRSGSSGAPVRISSARNAKPAASAMRTTRKAPSNDRGNRSNTRSNSTRVQ